MADRAERGGREEHQSWDEFWAATTDANRRTEVIRGIEVDVPYDLPLDFRARMEELSDSEDEDDVRELVAELYGENVMDAWRDAGMGAVEFQVVLAWGVAQGEGVDLDFAEAYELVTTGKPPARLEGNRATRRARAARNGSSASSGGRSRRTSAASTASRRPTSGD